MELSKNIPQFLPMYGKKIEVYYRGMEFTCLRCYGTGHKRQDCQNEKQEWMDYVVDFIKNNQFKNEMYGKWLRIAKAHRRKFNKKSEEEHPDEKTTEGNPEELPDGALEPEVTTDETAGAAGHDAGLPRDGTNAEHHGSEAKNKNGEDDSRDTENWQIPSYRNSFNYKKNTGTYADATRGKGRRPTYKAGTTDPEARTVTRSSSRKSSLSDQGKKNNPPNQQCQK